MTILVSERSELADLLADARRTSQRVALVPTMGALHAGHASLMTLAREHVGHGGKVIVTVFVNPLQFGAGEDLDRYPRTLDADLEVAASAGVDAVFAPSVEEMYPGGLTPDALAAMTTVVPGSVAEILEGASRPGHFRGVLTVVAKLFGLVKPDVAIFGQKDYQQLALIEAMATDLCLGIEVVGAPTARDEDGLALSSRNRYLSPAEREVATSLSRALRAGQEAAHRGSVAAHQAAAAVLAAEPGVELDYLEVKAADLSDISDHPEAGTTGRIVVAARVGKTRLIDNLPLTF